jgi:glycolate oxidase
MGMEVVPATEAGAVRRQTVKNVTACEFSSLFVGSEGTLGIITEITVVIPAPRSAERCSHPRTIEVRCPSPALSGTGDPGNFGFSTADHRDGGSLRTRGTANRRRALLLMRWTDGGSRRRTRAAAVVKTVAENRGELRMANSDRERDQLWAARRAALPALASLNNTVVLEDATVPRSRITEMLVACGNIGRKYNRVLGTFGHAGDGNLHPTILADKNNADEMDRVHRAVEEIFDTALALGGTLSGEHGIGIAKMKFLGNDLGESGLDPCAIKPPRPHGCLQIRQTGAGQRGCLCRR